MPVIVLEEKKKSAFIVRLPFCQQEADKNLKNKMQTRQNAIATLLFINETAYLEQFQHTDRWKWNGSNLVEEVENSELDESLQMKNRG